MIRAEPVAVTGAFNFGLKSIAKAMHAAGFISTTWGDGPTDGLRAMVAAWAAASATTANGMLLSTNPLVVEIARYNEVDCRVMWEIPGGSASTGEPSPCAGLSPAADLEVALQEPSAREPADAPHCRCEDP